MILSAFQVGRPTMGLLSLVAHTGLPKTTVFRAVETMRELGWLERIDKRYTIGPRLFEVATLSLLRVDLRETTLPYLADLYAATHQTVHLAALEGSQVRCAEKINGHQRTTELSRVGGLMPAYCTAVGKAVLAFAPPEVVDVVIDQGLVPRTPSTITPALG